jgi:hypothetical protein
MRRNARPHWNTVRVCWNRILSRLLAIGVTFVLIGTSVYSVPARAQNPTGQPEQSIIGEPAPAGSGAQSIEVLVKPYLWLPWTSLDISPSNTRIPSSSETIDPGKLISHLTWVPFMGAAEFRNDRSGFLIDYLHAPLKAGIGTRNILFTGGAGGLGLDTGTAIFLYRPLVQRDEFVDFGIGVRAWGLGGNISLNQGLLPAANVSNGLSWADPLIAVRYHRELGNGFSATAYGDVGGVGLGAHIDWQLIGTIDYAVNSSIDAHVGFRSLNFNYGAPRADFNLNMYGPIISATLRF